MKIRQQFEKDGNLEIIATVRGMNQEYVATIHTRDITYKAASTVGDIHALRRAIDKLAWHCRKGADD